MASRFTRAGASSVKIKAPEFGTSFYARVAGFSFAAGACMEGFMIKTGFYDKVTGFI
jgi:hypothetical protein